MMSKKIGLAFKPGLTKDQLTTAVNALDKVMLSGGSYKLVANVTPTELLTCDFVIAFGGDGTMLGVLRDLANETNKQKQKTRMPIVLGVNMGTVGFITDIPLAKAKAALFDIIHKGKYFYEQRNTLSITTNGLNECAANDILLQRAGGRLLDFEVELNGRFAYSCRADGLLISTPTGSTAYSLAAGGPILGPCVEAVLITPMMPQNLTSRPLVVTSDTRITVRLTGAQRAVLYIDGNEKPSTETEFKINKGPDVHFGYSNQHGDDRDFTKALRDKLGWM